MGLACNFSPLIATTELCPQILVKIGSANLHTDSFGGIQAVPCRQKDGRTKRHDMKNSLAQACKKLNLSEYYGELTAECGRVTSCHEREQRMAEIKDSET